MVFLNMNLKLFFEMLICIIYFLLFNVIILISGFDGDIVYVLFDLVLFIFMIFCVYFFGWVVVVYNKLFLGLVICSLSVFNRVDIDGVFVFKVLMMLNLGSVLIVIMVFILLINFWVMMNCEIFY